MYASRKGILSDADDRVRAEVTEGSGNKGKDSRQGMKTFEAMCSYEFTNKTQPSRFRIRSYL